MSVDGADEVVEVEGLDEDVVVRLHDEGRLRRLTLVLQPLEAHHVLVTEVVEVVDKVPLKMYQNTMTNFPVTYC